MLIAAILLLQIILIQIILMHGLHNDVLHGWLGNALQLMESIAQGRGRWIKAQTLLSTSLPVTVAETLKDKGACNKKGKQIQLHQKEQVNAHSNLTAT